MKTKLLLVVSALFAMATGVKADDAFVVWDETNTTLYFSYGTVPTEGGSWTNEAGTAVTVTKVWSGTDVTASPTNDGPKWYGSSRNTATKAVFESSFASVKPTSLHYWFLNHTTLATFEGL